MRCPAASEQPDGHRIAERGGPRHVLRGHPAVLVERGPQPLAASDAAAASPSRAERGPAGQRLEAADVAAATDDRRVVHDLDVPDVARRSLRPPVDPAVRDDPGADAGADLDDDDVVVADGDPGPPLAEGQDVDVVVDPDRRAVAVGEALAHRVAVPAGHDRRRDRAARCGTRPARARRCRCPTAARAGRASWRAAARTAPRRATGSAPARPMTSAGSSRWARIRPSRSVTATSMLVAPRSATRTWPASARKASRRGGRPPVLGPTSPSTTRPSSSSSPTRCATIAARQAGPAHELRARARPRRADLVEDGDQRVERLVGGAGGLGSASTGLTHGSYGDTARRELLHLTCQSTIARCNSCAPAQPPPSRQTPGRRRRPTDEAPERDRRRRDRQRLHRHRPHRGPAPDRRAGPRPARLDRRSGAPRAHERLGVPTAYASLDDLLADDRVEVVHVTSPNHLHHPQVKRDPRRGPPRGVREAAGDDLRRVARAGRAGRRERPGQRGELQHPLLPAQPARRASSCATAPSATSGS